jgi:hypothetical protein
MNFITVSHAGLPMRRPVRRSVGRYGVVAKYKPPRERIEEALREIGVLLMTFAPLDAAVSVVDSRLEFLIFFGSGFTLFVLALTLEGRRHRAIK